MSAGSETPRATILLLDLATSIIACDWESHTLTIPSQINYVFYVIGLSASTIKARKMVSVKSTTKRTIRSTPSSSNTYFGVMKTGREVIDRWTIHRTMGNKSRAAGKPVWRSQSWPIVWGIEVIHFEARVVRKCTGYPDIGWEENALWMWLFQLISFRLICPSNSELHGYQ